MKLHISRKQADVKGTKFLGLKMSDDHVGFSMTAKAELTDQEQGLIDKYRVHNFVLYLKLGSVLDSKGNPNVLRKVTISSLMGEKFLAAEPSISFLMKMRLKKRARLLKNISSSLRDLEGKRP